MEGEPSPSKKVKKEESVLDLLKKMTTVVADTGDFNLMKEYEPEDATTNPSLITSAASKAEYEKLIDDAIEYCKTHFKEAQSQKLNRRQSTRTSSSKKKSKSKEEEEKEKEEENKEQPSFNYNELSEEDKKNFLTYVIDKISVNFGVEISKIVKGYISTEADARLSFDKKSTVERAQRIIKLYEDAGVDKNRVLVKIAATYEGIEAAKQLKKQGIKTNLTLLFSFAQAVACAEAGVFLISPFVGRILDWFKKNKPNVDYAEEKDPGVQSVKKIFQYFKKHHYKTIILAASFRNTSEILNLAGCDRMTIAPALLSELKTMQKESIDQKLKEEDCANIDLEKINMDEKLFRWMMNEDEMANDKLSEGIRRFAEDTNKLEQMIITKLSK